MGHCRGCGVNLDDISSKNKYTLSGTQGGPICPTLMVFATDAVSQSQGPDCHLDEEEFEAGYVCKSCLRLVLKFQNLETKVKQVEKEISEKMSQAVHHFPVCTSQNIQQSPITVTGSRKRSATCLQSREENTKHRRLLQSVESIPTLASTSKSPDVAVSTQPCMHACLLHASNYYNGYLSYNTSIGNHVLQECTEIIRYDSKTEAIM